jgi:hypothetical protein
MSDRSCNGIGGILSKGNVEIDLQSCTKYNSRELFNNRMRTGVGMYTVYTLYLGRKFIIVTNHKALTWLVKLMIPVHKLWD